MSWGRYLNERYHLEEREALSVATLAGGAVGRALTHLESRGAQGSEPDQHVDAEIPEILAAMDRLAAFRIAEYYNENPDQLDILVEWYRDLLLLHQNVAPDVLTHIFHLDALKQLIPALFTIPSPVGNQDCFRDERFTQPQYQCDAGIRGYGSEVDERLNSKEKSATP